MGKTLEARRSRKDLFLVKDSRSASGMTQRVPVDRVEVARDERGDKFVT